MLNIRKRLAELGTRFRLEKLYWYITKWIYCSNLKCCGRNPKLVSGAVKGKDKISIGNDCFIGKDFLLGVYGKEGEIKIGDRFCAQQRVRISAVESVEIGDDVLLGSNILITDNDHGINPTIEGSYARQQCTASPVLIGDGVWIGEQCVILKGSHIGKRAVIGANSLVKGNIPPYTIAVGSPAKVIKIWNNEQQKWVKIGDENVKQ